ncbi:hypothetical protein [Actinacidiphila epipremni]|uniref:Uncharacterized protein n=1 Tax=Actinacidiphila epipremni TaxID=2053013 RepID=A0ABX0ZW48_9ACTN|nr:hypothetical protein [Actinacidiphila epipremni]NJP46509.1 hypothetical protein [Actinacidiphila epipremni]
MANIVWHAKFKIRLDLNQDDLGHPQFEGLWERLYWYDRACGVRGVPVAERGLLCGGVCQQAGVEAWMYLRERNGRREAVHERAEDEERHQVVVSPEHRAYQERIVRTAEEAGFRAESEVVTPFGRKSFIRTDTLVDNGDGLKIGWEVQLSDVGITGPGSVGDRVGKARKLGITPAWHTDRPRFAQRNDTQWTMSSHLPAEVIARTGDLRVVSGFRVLDFFTCDLTAVYQCPDGVRRCGKIHVLPKVRDIMFDDLVRRTAAGAIVPIEHRVSTRTLHRFWVTSTDHTRYLATFGPAEFAAVAVPVVQVQRGSSAAPTCRPAPTTPTPTQSARAVLDWNDPSHWAPQPGPCCHCGKQAQLLDDLGRHSHKVCAEQVSARE